MSRQLRTHISLLLVLLVVATGCHPTQPFYFHEDGDLSHYLDRATEIEYPDVEQASLAEVEFAEAPLTLSNADFKEIWDLSLEEATSIALQNSKVIRNLGGVTPFGFAGGLVDRTQRADTIYDVAIQETQVTPSPLRVDGNGNRPVSEGLVQQGQGVEDALSEFDAQFTSQLFWNTTDRPLNTQQGLGQQFLAGRQQQGTFQSALSKRIATGGVVTARNQTIYNSSNQGIRALPSDWFTAMEVELSHPLLRGRGAQINRIPVVLARINTDITLAQFEIAVRNMTLDLENAYWDLYFAYRTLEANKIGRDSALGVWRLIHPQVPVTKSVQEEAQVRQQYFFFRAQVETAWRDLLNAENRLRFLMGLSPTDGRLIRPSDEPSMAKVEFAWRETHAEALFRSPELRQQKWRVKSQELQLIAARNQLLPQLNVSGLYRWLGMGDDLIEADRNGANFPAEGSLAFDELTEGNYQEVRLGLEFAPPAIGARRQLAGVRNAQLQLAREKARLEDSELNQIHTLTTAIRNLDANFANAQSHFNSLAASEAEVQALQTMVQEGAVALDVVLDAQRRQADTLTAFYRALSEYNKSIAEVHFRKGSLLEYNNIALAEGPWPQKAYWDALERARERDASYYLDYGYTRPNVVSRGAAPHQQGEMLWPDAGMPLEAMPGEQIPTPAPTPAEPPRQPGDAQPGGGAQPGPVTSTPAGEGRLAQQADPSTFAWGELGLHRTPITSINPLRQVNHEEELKELPLSRMNHLRGSSGPQIAPQAKSKRTAASKVPGSGQLETWRTE